MSSVSMRRCLVLALLGVVTLTAPVRTQSSSILSPLGFSAQDIAAIEGGRAVARVLQWGGPSEVYIVGAVHVNGSPTAFLQASRDVKHFAARSGYLGAGELSAAATAADLAALDFDAADIQALKTCRDRSCDLQLPAGSIRRFRDDVDWSRPDAPAEVNRLARQMLIDLLNAYRRGGNAALGAFDDKARPAVVGRQFETMVTRAAALPDMLPELREYLLRYPDATLPGAETFFYWEKVSFGLKPTIRLNHAVVYHTRPGDWSVDVVAIKQLYASHYFHTALDVWVCIADRATPGSPGFYLLTLKSSEQEGLTGLRGSLLRKIVADKSRGSLEAALMSIKSSLESAG